MPFVTVYKGEKGDPGPRGPAGPPGTPGGGSGADASYVHEQLTASTTWVVNHDLPKKPSVTTVDSLGRVIHGTVEYTGETQITITFLTADAGFAYLN